MTDIQQHPSPATAVDDVRKVREKISQQHGGNVHQHVQESTRIANELRAKLGVRVLPVPKQGRRPTGT